MTDRELLEAAAKAAGIEGRYFEGVIPTHTGIGMVGHADYWNPLTDDGNALRLAVSLGMTIRIEDYGTSARIEGKPHGAWNGCEAHLYGGIEAATRRAIVRAAAAIGSALK